MRRTSKMNKSETIGKIASALVAFAGDIRSISKDSTNPHYKSQYTTLDHMIAETKPILHKHGLTILQQAGGDGSIITINTLILHESGEWIETEALTLKPVKIDPQGAGSAITYGRRYAYASALSLSLGDDDDANSVSEDKPTASLKAKYQLGKGSLDGYEEWTKDQKSKGITYAQMEETLTRALIKKNKEEA
jgi:hypothetical protein